MYRYARADKEREKIAKERAADGGGGGEGKNNEAILPVRRAPEWSCSRYEFVKADAEGLARSANRDGIRRNRVNSELPTGYYMEGLPLNKSVEEAAVILTSSVK